MTKQQIQIPRKLTTQLLHLAQISPDSEVCGLVGSKNGLVTSCYPITNIANQPERHFLLDAKQQIQAMTQIRERNEELFAIYHSHPTAPAQPSIEDLELAAYPEALYLIISLNTKGVLEMRGFRLENESFEEVTLALSEEQECQ